MKTRLTPKNIRSFIVLGAGATRGSSLANGASRPLPPLNADFFTQVQRIRNPKYQEYIQLLLAYLHKTYGPGWSLGMEEFFNQTSYLKHFASERVVYYREATRRDPETGKRLRKPTKQISVEMLFKQLLLGVLEESLFDNHSHQFLDSTCIYHDRMAEALGPLDAIASFNYDCLIDASLATKCPFWDPASGYGFSPIVDSGLDFWSHKARVLNSDKVSLFKLHGSINWQEVRSSGDATKTRKLLMRPYTRQNGDRNFDIIPPAIAKEQYLPLYRPIWLKCLESMRRAELIAVVGYSLPPADALAEALFRSRQLVREGEPVEEVKYLIIANPDRAVRRRLISVLRKLIRAETRVLVYDDLKQMTTQLFE